MTLADFEIVSDAVVSFETDNEGLLRDKTSVTVGLSERDLMSV